MSQELIYTSAPQGLKPGSKGFSTVAITAGLPTAWIERLESLSGYRPIYPLGDPNAQKNPVNQSHWRMTIAGKQRSVLSRVAFAGADYSGRSNKLGHHIVVEPNEQAAGGPAWMLLKPGVMRTAWVGNPQQLPSGPALPTGDRASRPAAAWASALGDAGWAAFLAESFATEAAKPAYLICSPSTNVLALFEESLALLPQARRWEVTFSTFFSELPLNLNCAWRAVIAGTPAATEALRMGPRVRLLDLTKPAGTAPTGPYADAARAGSGPVGSAVTTSRSTALPTKVDSAISEVEDADSTGIGMAALAVGGTTTTGTAVRGGHRKLRTAGAPAFDVMEELPDISDLGKPDEDMPIPKVVKQGVPWWVFIVTQILFLGVSVGACLLAMKLERQKLNNQISRAESDRDAALAQMTQIKDAAAETFRQATLKENSAISTQKQTDLTVAASKGAEQTQNDTIDVLNKELKKANAEIDTLQAEKDKQGQDNSAATQKITQLTNANLALQKSTETQTAMAIDSSKPVPRDPDSLDAESITISASFDDNVDDFSISLPMPSYSSAKLQKIAWPNGKDEFVSYSDKDSKFNLTQKGNESLQAIIICTPSAGTLVNPHKKVDLFVVCIKAGKLTINRADKNAVSTTPNLVAARKALEESSFGFTSQDGGQPLTPLTIVRKGKTETLTNSKNAFDPPALPLGMDIKDVHIDGGNSDWEYSDGDDCAIFSHHLSQKNQVAQFKVRLVNSDGRWSLAFETQTSDYLELIKLRSKKDVLLKTAVSNEKNAQSDLDQHKDKKGNAPQNFQSALDIATKQKSGCQDEFNIVDGAISEWQQRYSELKDFPISLRLPNNVEIKSVSAYPPPFFKKK